MSVPSINPPMQEHIGLDRNRSYLAVGMITPFPHLENPRTNSRHNIYQGLASYGLSIDSNFSYGSHENAY
jgi:hypothetical protein